MDRAPSMSGSYYGTRPGRMHRGAMNALLVGAYIAAYVFLDWVSYIHPVGPYAITVWNPPPGVSLALLLGVGLRYAPALFVAAVLAEVIVRHGPGLGEVAVYAGILAGGYTALGALLRRLRFNPSFRSLRDLIVFVAVVGAGVIGIAALYVAAHIAAGHFTWSDFTAHTVHFWVGDVIGIVTTTPFLLIHGRRLARGQRPRLTVEGVLQALAIAAVLALIYQLEPQRAANLLYLMFMPLVWISTRYGFEGATAGILAMQLGLIAVLNLADYPADWVLQFELEMVALAVTGAFLGMTSTQWRRAREALENREVELKTIFATAPDAIVSLDERYNVIDANAAAEGMFGMTVAELKHQTLSGLVENLPPDVSTAKAVSAHARRRDGQVFPVEVSFGSGMVEGRRVHIGVVRDMAERKEMEEKLRERDRHLDRTLRVAAAAEMASALAHELNQPLTAASAYVQSLELLLARHDKHDADLADAMRKTVSEVGRAGSIVRRLREFYRRDAGKLEAVPVALLFDSALAPLKSRIDRHRITVAVSIEPDTPMLLVDRVQIEMVLHNVLRNAVDSVAESDAAMRHIEFSARAGQPGFVTIGIEDTGPGVSPAIAEQIFKSFATSRNEGTGLGLAISRSIVERHGGRLWLDQSRTGARFMITLPAARG